MLKNYLQSLVSALEISFWKWLIIISVLKNLGVGVHWNLDFFSAEQSWEWASNTLDVWEKITLENNLKKI